MERECETLLTSSLRWNIAFHVAHAKAVIDDLCNIALIVGQGRGGMEALLGSNEEFKSSYMLFVLTVIIAEGPKSESLPRRLDEWRTFGSMVHVAPTESTRTSDRGSQHLLE